MRQSMPPKSRCQRGGIFLGRDRERQSSAHLGFGMSVHPCLAHGKVQGKIVAYSPDRAGQDGHGLLGVELPFVVDLGDRPELPLVWSFDNGSDEQVGMMVAGEGGASIEMNSSPIPSLRNDAEPARADAVLIVDTGQQDPEFRGDARSSLLLKGAL